MAAADWQPLATIAAAALGALIAGSVAFLNRRDDSLAKAERLSKVTDSMRESPGKRLVTDLRDFYAVEWSLRRSAPRMPFLNGVAMFFYLIGLALFVSLGFLVIPKGFDALFDANFWELYGSAILVFAIAQICRATVVASRNAWVLQEREWRGLEPPVSDRQKRVKIDALRVLELASPINMLFQQDEGKGEQSESDG
jgi:hypothetical protein